MITRLDDYVGKVMELLKSLGLEEKTLVIFTSDNGPHKEGGHIPEYFDSNGDLQGIKRDLYEGGIRVPFIARWKGKISVGKTSTHISSFPDMLSTFAQLAQQPTPQSTTGISMLPSLLRKERQARHRYLYWEFYEQGGSRAVRMGDWKGVRKSWHAPIELYNLKKDIGETTNLAKKHPKIVAQIENIMEEARIPSEQWQIPTKLKE